MKSLQRFLLVILTLASANAFAAPDRIGNGGGVWMCESPNGDILDLMFMDIFEARREYQLNVPETNENPLYTVQSKKKWIQQFLPYGTALNEHILYVEKNITWIDDIIVSIPDAANKITPHPSLCKQGKWLPVQLVNFTDDFRILVRRELFDSPLMTDVERAAVYLHEGIYSYLRSEFSDKDSVRARAIVGLLMSDLSDAQKVERIAKVISKNSPEPQPKPPVGGFMCGIKPGDHSPLYIFEAGTETKAREEVLKVCVKGEDPFPPGFPGGFIPGFPGGVIPGPPNECKEHRVLCEPITTSEKNKSCSFDDFFESKKYTGTGRTFLEAQKEAMTRCLIEEGSGSTCYSFRNLVCE
ncbi:hypothetical protein D3C87_88150 [compost metagenome]